MSNSDLTNWWHYFEKTNNKTHSKCRHCAWEKPRDKTFSTKGMKYHLESQHPQLYSQKLEAERIQQKKDDEKKRKLVQQPLFSGQTDNEPVEKQPKVDAPISIQQTKKKSHL